MPAEARGTSEKSAKAFARHWVNALNYAGPAGDTDQLRSLSDQSCEACIAIVDLIDAVHAEGGHIKGRGWEIRAIQTLPATEPGTALVDVRVRVHPQTISTSSTQQPETFNGGQRLKTFWLEKKDEGWQVTRLDQPQ